MKSSPLIPLALLVLTLHFLSSLWAAATTSPKQQDFIQCLIDHSPDSSSITKVIYTPINSSYYSILHFSIENLRFSKPEIPKPLAIITPSHVSHIQAAVVCSKSHGLQIRTRSGGHDFEGLSYVAYVPFVVVDLINLKSISIDVKNKTAWAQAGATIGELYYSIAQKSRTLAFAAGVCPTVGLGGFISGGGYGHMLRKYGLAADNVIDAYLVDANGKFQDRESMGEDLFWAIRGGGGGSFGIVVAWKLKLVPVPTTVTVCFSNRTLEEGAIKLIHQWQYVANKLDENLYLGIELTGGKKNPAKTSFLTSFLGKVDKLVAILKTTFPDLGLAKEECTETSWIESILIEQNGSPTNASLETMLNRRETQTIGTFKFKSDYVMEPLSEAAIEGIWKRLQYEDIDMPRLVFVPYGGRMSQISESEIPFSHRAKYLYKIGYFVYWQKQGINAEQQHLKWIRELYQYLTHFVSKSPRAAYVNYRDLDIGSNKKFGKTSYEQASVWGLKYFGNNFNRLVHVKTKVDPYDFFRHEQSIPPLSPTTIK